MRSLTSPTLVERMIKLFNSGVITYYCVSSGMLATSTNACDKTIVEYKVRPMSEATFFNGNFKRIKL